eukprot:1662799-Pyramimonas_sp.AAC.1
MAPGGAQEDPRGPRDGPRRLPKGQKKISQFTVVARSVSLCASLLPFFRQPPYASFVDGLVGILFDWRLKGQIQRAGIY